MPPSEENPARQETREEAESAPASPARPAWLERMERKKREAVEADAEPRREGNGLPARDRGPGADGAGELPPSGRDGDAAAGTSGGVPARAALPPRPTPNVSGEEVDATELALERFREEAIRIAREDAAAGVPKADMEGISQSEQELRERALAFFERWRSRERSRLDAAVAAVEEKISDALGRASIAIDRFERLTNDLLRLKARLVVRRREVNEALDEEGSAQGRQRGIPTKIYLAAIGFLGVVEFFANAPVFGSLLPRDPLTERQIRLVAETSEGWLAGAQRVLAQFILRPDAALLAAGVVTFLCVLAHFFGHSLRDFVMQRDRETPRDTVAGRSALESLVPMVLSSIGLVLVIGVLYEARVTLGRVGEERFVQDMAAVEELRREAGWLRADGDLLAANEVVDRADDMEAAATELREYAGSMSRLSFPILLLNMTLVLCAISAAYFHQRDRRSEYFDESPFEEERKMLVEAAEAAATEISTLLSSTVRHIRELRSLLAARPLAQSRSVLHQLEAAISLYRTENGRARGVDPRTIPAFQTPLKLHANLDASSLDEPYASRDPAQYEEERRALKDRFEAARQRFTREAVVSG